MKSMELYFNPYPEPSESIEEGLARAIDTANILVQLNKKVQTITVNDANNSLLAFVVVRQSQRPYWFQEILNCAQNQDRDKLILLLSAFSKGRVIDIANQTDILIENWTISDINIPVPILEYAVKSGGVALTVATSPGWDTNYITFQDQDIELPNLWGQCNIAHILNHYAKSLDTNRKRFAFQYNATYCVGALNSAPNDNFWEQLGFFTAMDRAKDRDYNVDDNLIKNVGNTKYGCLYELRCYDSGWRIFFACQSVEEIKLFIAGFYEKGKLDQNEEICKAIKRVNRIDDSCSECCMC